MNNAMPSVYQFPKSAARPTSSTTRQRRKRARVIDFQAWKEQKEGIAPQPDEIDPPANPRVHPGRDRPRRSERDLIAALQEILKQATPRGKN